MRRRYFFRSLFTGFAATFAPFPRSFARSFPLTASSRLFSSTASAESRVGVRIVDGWVLKDEDC